MQVFSVRKGSSHWYWYMIFNDRGKIPSGIHSILKSSDNSILKSSYIVSILYLDSCVVSWFTLFGNFDSASTAMFSSPFIYLISGPYSSNISLHCNTLSVLKFLHVKFSWSVYIFNFLPNKIVRNSFKILTILSNSFSVTVYHAYGPVSLRL